MSSAVEHTLHAKANLDDVQSTLWALEERLKGIQGSHDAELRTALRALERAQDDVEKAHEVAEG